MASDSEYARLSAACHEIAELLKCDEDLVLSIFSWIPDPFSSQPKAMKLFREENAQFRRLSILAKRFEIEILSVEGMVLEKILSDFNLSADTFNQLSKLFHVLGEAPSDAPAMRSTKGGKNFAAEDVAIGVKQLFEALGRSVTFGHDAGKPTTNFGRAVLSAFKAFEIDANWREYARSASNDTKFNKKS